MKNLNIYLSDTDDDIRQYIRSIPQSQRSSTFRRLIRTGIEVEETLGQDWRVKIAQGGLDVSERLERIERMLSNGVVVSDEIKEIGEVNGGFEL